jgi:hypothetical protein
MSLILWMPLDGNTNDYTVNNNTGVNTNVTFVNGKIGQAGSFNGSTSNINNGLSSYLMNEISQTNKLSISAWFRFGSTFTAERAITRKQVAFQLGLINSGAIRNLIMTSGGTTGWTGVNDITYPFQVNTWYNMVMAWDGLKMRTFVNGVQVGEATVTGTFSLSSTDPLCIGSGQLSGTPTNYWNGDINDVRIYNHALSQKEINDLAKAKVLHYTFNKDDGNIVYDNSGLKRNATVNGATWTDQGYSFNGSTNSIERSMLDSLGVNSFTINLWAYFEQTNVRDVILGTFNGSNPLSFNFEKHTSNRLRFYWQGTTDIFSANDVVPIQQRCMLTLIRDKEQGRIKMFVNGQNVVNQVATASDITSFDNRTLFIGRDIRTTSEATNGKLDDIVFYTTALSDANILDMYQTRAKIDNEGNLYANEFVEDYEITTNLTLNNIFNDYNDSNFVEPVKLYKDTFRIASVSFTALSGDKIYVYRNLYEHTIAFSTLNMYYYDGINAQYFGTGLTKEFSTIHTMARNQTTMAFYIENNTLNNGTYAFINNIYIINLSKLVRDGYFVSEPTKDQMDTWLRDYKQSRMKQNGQFISREFNEVGIDTIAVNGLTYRQIFETNNLMPNPFVDTNSNGLFDDAYSGGSPVVSFVDGFQLLQSSFNNVYIIKAIGSIALNNNYYLNFQAQKINNAASNFTIGFGATSGFISINRTSYTNISFDLLNRFSHIQTITETPATNPQLLLSGFGGTSSNVKFNDFYIINLTALGINQTKAQMDQLYTEYRQLKTEEQALRIFKDKIHIQGSLNEGGQ